MFKDNVLNYKSIVNELKPHYPNLNEYEIALGCFYKIEDFIKSRTSYLKGYGSVSICSDIIPDDVNVNCNIITEEHTSKYLLKICYELIRQIIFNRTVYSEVTFVKLISCVTCDIVSYMKQELPKPKIKLRDYYVEDISEFCNEFRSAALRNDGSYLSVEDVCKLSFIGLCFTYDKEILNIIKQNHQSLDRDVKDCSNILPKIKISSRDKISFEIIPMENGKYILYLFIIKHNFLRPLIRKLKFWKNDI